MCVDTVVACCVCVCVGVCVEKEQVRACSGKTSSVGEGGRPLQCVAQHVSLPAESESERHSALETEPRHM
jgi:hypothetical protein